VALVYVGQRLFANAGWFSPLAKSEGWFSNQLSASSGGTTDPVLVTSVTSSATGNTTTTYSQALASTTTGDINIIAINVSPQANLTDPGIPTIDGTAVDPTPGNTAGGWTTIGTAWDSSGNPVPNVRITAQGARRNGHNDDNNLETFTNDSGKYAFHGIDSADERYYLFTAARRPDPFDTRYIGDTGLGRYGQVIRGPIDTQNITNVDFTLQPATSKITAHVGTSDGGQMLVPFGEEGDDNLPEITTQSSSP
jgi:hypothetical protein